jgi:small subunit ribosomal protein S9
MSLDDDKTKQPADAQGHVEEPTEIAAEDAVGAQEQPTPRQQEREQAIVDEPVAESEQRIAEATAPASSADNVGTDDVEDLVDETPRVKPEIPGADLVPDIVLDGEDRVSAYDEDGDDLEEDGTSSDEEEDLVNIPITSVQIDLAAGARYRATGKRKTACARVILKPGTGVYTINGKTLNDYFPRATLQRQIRQPLETVGLTEKMDVVASMHGGGVSAQAGALRHGISRALIEADPNLRSDLKRRGFLTRDARVKERKKAGLKKARKRPQFSKR